MEEWTNADTGVGAAIAAGNHDENGICALFVIAANIKIRGSHKGRACHSWKAVQVPVFRRVAIAIIIRASPMRLVRAVSIPAAMERGF